MNALSYRLIVGIGAVVGLALAMMADAPAMSALVSGLLGALVGFGVCLAVRASNSP